MIESAQNNTIKKVTKLKEKKYRDRLGLFVVEGRRFADEALEWDVEEYLISESFSKKNDISKYEKSSRVLIVTDELMEKITDTVEPQGILAVCTKKKYSPDVLFQNNNPFIIVCENISDPGNLGTVIRTAFAAGIDGIVLSENCVDCYSPKVIRAAAGMVFRIPIIDNINLQLFFETCKQREILLFGAHLKAKEYYYDMNFRGSGVFVIGNEASGLTDATAERMDYLIKIPMEEGAESLNAAVASGILIYEAVRQRKQSD